jgi:hypothetical protein
MPSPKQHRLSADCRRALQVLAASPDGYTEAIMLAHGFKPSLLVDLIRDGLATAKPEREIAGRRTVEVARMRITDAGRQGLARQR